MRISKLYIFTAMVVGMLLSSCKGEDPVLRENEEMEYFPVSFSISLASEDEGTRSNPELWEPGENSDQDGVGFDNIINSINPVLYSVTGNHTNTAYPVGQVVGDLTWTPKKKRITVDGAEKEVDDYTNYIITGIMKTPHYNLALLNEPGAIFRLALFINCGEGDVKVPLSVTSPGTAIFHHHGIPGDNRDGTDKSVAFTGIPMFGISNVTFDKKDNKYQILASDKSELRVPVLRSMAKVRVKLADELKASTDGRQIKLKKLEMSRHAVRGYVVPKKWNEIYSVNQLTSSTMMNAYIGSSIENDYNHDCTIINIENNDDMGQGVWQNSNDLIRFYLPETYNHDHDGIEDYEGYKTEEEHNKEAIVLYITYELEDGAEKTHSIFFKPYTHDGKPDHTKDCWDIIRNHIYEFVINGVEASTGELTISVAAKEWGSKEIETIEYDTPVPSGN